MRLTLTALAALSLVACAPQGDTYTDTDQFTIKYCAIVLKAWRSEGRPNMDAFLSDYEATCGVIRPEVEDFIREYLDNRDGEKKDKKKETS